MFCEYCNFTTNNLDKFESHKKTKRHMKNFETYNKKSSFLCDICEKIFFTKAGLTYHYRLCKNKKSINKKDKEVEEDNKITDIVLENKININDKEIDATIIILRSDKDSQTELLEDENITISQSDDYSYCTLS